MGSEQWLTVSEAAERYGLSVATVRRWVSLGQVAGMRSGRQWLVDAGSLEEKTAPQSKPDIEERELTKSLLHIRHLDLKEEWVPDVLLHADELLNEKLILEESSRRISQAGPFDPQVDVEVPKTPYFARTGALLTLPDRVAYHIAALKTLERIESQGLRLNCVYSARPSGDPRYLLVKGRDLWLEWQEAVRKSVSQGYSWVAKTDITAFFDSIQHRSLLLEMEALRIPTSVLRALREMLNTWAPVAGMGLPQGPDASRVLANLYLFPVDRALQSSSWLYLRFMDDIRILAKSRAAAIEGLRVLEREMKLLGLVLSAKKTDLSSGGKALADSEDDKLAAAQYLIAADRDKTARKVLREILRTALRQADDVDFRRAKFSIWRLRLLHDKSAIDLVLKHLDSLAPLASLVATYVQPWLSRPSVERNLSAFLHDSERNTSVLLSAWLMAAMLDRLGDLPISWIDYARAIAHDRNEPQYHRGIAVNLLGRGLVPSDLQWIKRQIRSDFDIRMVRSHLVALARASELDRASARYATQKDERLGATATYLKGRTSLPSLIYRDQAVPVDAR